MKSKLLCVYIIMAPSLSSHTGGNFATPNKRISITGTFPREELAWVKLSAICYIYVETQFPSLLLWPALLLSYSYKLITKTLPLPLSTVVPTWTSLCQRFYLWLLHRFHEPEMYRILCWVGRIVLLFGTCLSPGFHKGFLLKMSSISFWENS